MSAKMVFRVAVVERDTSPTCPTCGHSDLSTRSFRGWYYDFQMLNCLACGAQSVGTDEQITQALAADGYFLSRGWSA